MMRRGTVSLIFAAVLMVTAACAPAAGPAPSPAAAPSPSPASSPPTAVSTRAPEPKLAAPSPTAPPAATSMKFGSVKGISDAGVYVAMEKGYFKEQGIDLEAVEFRSTADIIAPLGTGGIEVGAIPMGIPLLNAADRGVEIKIVADKAQSAPGWEFSWIVLRKDLKDSGQVKTPADLKGMRVSIPSLGSTGDETVQVVLERAGLTPKDVEVVLVPFADVAAAMGNKAIAAGVTMEPFLARGTQDGIYVKWISRGEVLGKTQMSTIAFGPTLLKNRELGQRWMVAYLKGVRDYLKAFTTKEGQDAIVNALIKNTTIKDPKLYDLMEMPYFDPNGVPDKKSIDAQYKWFLAKGLYTGKRTFDEMLDLSFVEYAAQKLGKAQ